MIVSTLSPRSYNAIQPSCRALRQVVVVAAEVRMDSDFTPLTLEPLHAGFGARVTGVDLTGPPSDDVVQVIRRAMYRFSLLCFPDQAMSDDAQLALTRCLGTPEPNHVKRKPTCDKDYIGPIGNVIDAKTHRGNDDPRTRDQAGNQQWHTDSSYRVIPAMFSINHAYEVPLEGGETEFASTRIAYEGLSLERRAIVDPLHVIHDFVYSRSKAVKLSAKVAADVPPVEHRLVRVNPSNGRKSYYVGAHARSIVGWSQTESRALIDELLQRATGRDHVYSHRWSVGDTIIWDNRCMLHRGAGYDADRWRRHMRQTRVAGLAPTLDE